MAIAAVLKTAVPKGTWGFESLALRVDAKRENGPPGDRAARSACGAVPPPDVGRRRTRRTRFG